MEKDYTNFDYLHLTVKREKLDDVLSHYRALRWDDYEQKEDKIYGNIVHISMRRPHKIENKDKLQLMQVYLEQAWNTIGNAENNSHPKTLIFGLTTELIATALLMAGIYLFLLISFTWGIVFMAVGAAAFVICIAFTVILYRRESKELNKKLERAEKGLALFTEYTQSAKTAVTTGTAEEAASD